VAYGTPTDPVGGTVITVAYAVANILDPLRWLRLMTGNADPPGSAYVVVSDSATGTTWRKVPADALAAGAVVAHLGYTPVSRNGDFMAGPLLLSNDIAPIQARRTDGIDQTVFWMASDNRLYVGEVGTRLRLRASDEFSVFVNGSGWHTIWHAGNAPASADVHSVQSRVPGTGAGALAFYDGAGKVAAAGSADTAGTATSAASATSAANATNVTSTVGGVPIGSYARLDTTSNFTAVPTINSRGVAARNGGSYAGNGATFQGVSLGFVPLVVLVTEVTNSSNGCSAVVIGSTTITTQQVSGVTSTIINNSGGISSNTLLARQDAGINTSGKTYTWVALG
jgi:hypothetical protein